MDFWKSNLTALLADPDIKETAKCLKKEASTELPCFDRIGAPIQIAAILGGQQCEDGKICDSCSLCRKTAKSLAITFLLNNNFYMNKIAEIWERDIFIDEINKFNEEQKKSTDKVQVRIDYMSERSVPDALDEQNHQNMWFVVLSYILMFLYISISMGEFPSLMFSRVLLAFGGIMVVVLSFLTSISLVSLFGIKLSLISAEVVPFLVLAIGVDNMFIITGAKDRKKIGNINELMGSTLKEVGPSITTAAFSEFLAFIVGFLTKIPALQSFCLAAAFAVLIDYFLIMTIFLGLVTLDEMRVRDRRYDIIPIKSSDVDSKPKRRKFFHKFLSGPYYNFLMKTPVKITILVVYIVLIILSFVATMQFPLGLDQNTTVSQGSSLYRYFHTQAELVDVGPPAYIVFYNIDYKDKDNLKIFNDLFDRISYLDTVQPPVYSWYKDFLKFLDIAKSECNIDTGPIKQLPFELQVKEFLSVKIDSACCTQSSVCGEPYINDIFFSEDGNIEATRFRFQHVPLKEQKTFVNSLIQTKVIVEEYMNKFTLIKGKNRLWKFGGKDVEIAPAYPYSLFYVYYDQYTFIRGISLENTMIALASIFLAVQLLMNVKSAFVVINILKIKF